MLSQLNENTPILLQNLQCPIRTPLVARFQMGTLLLFIHKLVILIQRNTIAITRISQSTIPYQPTKSTYSFMHTANVLTTLPVLSTALYACFTSSVNAAAVAPSATVAAARRTLRLGLRLDRPALA